MNAILVCTDDPILMKSLSGVLREDGFTVDPVEHTALAVQMAFRKRYAVVIIDSECIGLSAMAAARMINSVAADTEVLLVGEPAGSENTVTVGKPLDLEEVRRVIRNIQEFKTTERRV